MNLFRSKLALAGSLPILGLMLTSACNNTVVLRSKERVALAPGSGIHSDSFSYGQPWATVDVLFVVDKTREGEGAYPEFRAQYGRFLEMLQERSRMADARLPLAMSLNLVNYQVQSIATPTDQVPEFFFGKNERLQAHLSGVFDEDRAADPGTGASSAPILTTRSATQFFEVRPFASALALLNQKIFENRKSSILFLVFVIETDPAAEETKATLATLKAALKARGQNQKVHPWLIFSRRKPEQLERQLVSLSWRTLQEARVDDRDWPENLVDNITKAAREMVLTYTPIEPQLMTVKKADHLFIYNEDYVWNSQSNAIRFLKFTNLSDKDPISVSYFVGNSSPGLSGKPTPGRPGLSGEKK